MDEASKVDALFLDQNGKEIKAFPLQRFHSLTFQFPRVKNRNALILLPRLPNHFVGVTDTRSIAKFVPKKQASKKVRGHTAKTKAPELTSRAFFMPNLW